MKDSMFDCSNLEYGIKYDITTHSGQVYRGWYLYSQECGYFSKKEGSQLEGFLYSESVASVKESD